MTGTTISGVILSSVTLSNAATQNPATVASNGTILAPTVGLLGESGTAWTVTNYGVVQGGSVSSTTAAAIGIALYGGGVLTNQTQATIGGYLGVLVANAAGTITNAGTIIGESTTGLGVALLAGGSVTNQALGRITGLDGVFANDSAASVVNFGSIGGTNDGVRLRYGGVVSNQPHGTIAGGNDGVRIYGTTAATVTNQGTIIGTSLAGVGLASGGLVSNATTGVIQGSSYGIDSYGFAATVTNYGVVTASSVGVGLSAGGTLSNASGGSILGGSYGVKTLGTVAATVINQGSIDGGTQAGVDLTSGGLISNQGTGIISGYAFGIESSNYPATIVNDGTVTAAFIDNAGSVTAGVGGVVMYGGGTLSNASGGLIRGGNYGVAATNVAATVTNQGSISGPNGAGVLFVDGGYLSNSSGGTITGVNFGVQVSNAIAASTVNNQGYISSSAIYPGAQPFDSAGVDLVDGGTVINGSSADIRSTWKGVEIGAQDATNGGTVLNQGTIFAENSNDSTGAGVWIHGPGLVSNAATGTITGKYGVVAYYQTTLVNLGTIVGKNYAFVADNPGFADLVVVGPGAVFSGTVSGGNPIGFPVASTLELTTGTSAGTLSGFGSKYIDFAQVTVDAGATWNLTSNDSFAAGITLTDSGTVTLDANVAPSEIGFAGTAAFVKLDGAASFTGGIYGFGRGDMLDIGPATVGSIIQQYGQSGGPPVLTVLSNTDGTLFSAAFSGTYGNPVGNDIGTYAVNTLTSGAVVAGPYELLTQNGDTVLEELPTSTWSWTGADTIDVQDPTNWTLVSGPGNQQGSPNSGDTVLVNNGTVTLPRDSTLNGNTIHLTGTSDMNFVGDQTGTTLVSNGNTNVQNGIGYQNPTVDGESLITNDATVAPADTTLNFAGYTVNQGTIASDASAGSSLTLNVTQDGTAPGYFLNHGDIEADAGNTVTITIAGTSEMFNANLIYANGGTVVFNGETGIAGGYAPMLGGIALIGAGGTLDFNAGFPTGTTGSGPLFAFYDETSGNTLKLDQLGQFSGRILGFQQNDTIDLGSALSIGTIVVTADGRLLLESAGSVDTLVLSSGAYNTGTYAVAAVSAGTFAADGFILTAGADGDTLLTTDVVDSDWNGTSGIWQDATAWSGGIVPGTTSAAIIGINASGSAVAASSPFVLTTGSVAVDVNSLAEVNSAATLEITSDTTVGTSTNEYPIQQIVGEIEITGGNTLTATELKQLSPGADLQIDAGGVLALTGHSNLGLVNAGTISESTVVNGNTFANGDSVALFVMGNATVDGGTIDAGPVVSDGSVVSTGGLISIGEDGGSTPATMTVENGATVTDTYGFLSSDPTSFGSLTLTGAGTTWDDASDPTDLYNTRGDMVVGYDNQSGNQPSPAPSGTAQLLVENDATLIEANDAQIGDSVDSAGSATITAGGIWNIGTSGASGGTGGFMGVGDAGSGTLVIDNNGTVNILAGTGTITQDGTQATSKAGIGIAHDVGSDGTVIVSGGGQLNVAISSGVTGSGVGVGQLGHGVLDIFNGGTVAITNGGFSAGSDSTVIAVGTTVAGDGTIVVGGTFDPNGTVESSGGASAVLMTSGGGAGIGKAGTGTLFVEAGGTVQVSGGGIDVGDSAGAYGLAVINGGLVNDTTSGLTVGDSGTGTLELLNSGTISLSGGGIDVGTSNGAQGLLEIASGGMLTSTTNGMNVGQSAGSSGTLEVLAGGIYNISTHSISAGVSAGATGTILVDGVGSRINIQAQTGTFSVSIGQAGTGELTVQNGGSFGSAVNVNIASVAGSTGTVTVTGGGTLATSGTAGINVGAPGNGLLTIGVGQETLGVGDTVSAAGTVIAANFFSIATGGTAANGTVVVNGGTLFDRGIFNVANTGAGTLIVEGGGLVDQTGINFNVGVNSGSHGTVTVNGGTLITNGGFSVGGANASGTLLVENSGSLSTSSGATATINASGAGAAVATVTSNGVWTDQGALIVGNAGTGALSINAGGVVTVTGATDVGNAAGGSGTVTVGSGGTLSDSLLSISNASTGSAGTLSVTTGGTVEVGTLTAGAGGTVTVTGSIFASSEIAIGQNGTGLAVLTVGTQGLVSDSGNFLVGTVTAGSLTVQNGGTVTGNGTNTLQIESGSTVTVNGGGLLEDFGNIAVGGPSSGTLVSALGTIEGAAVTVENGGLFSTGNLTVGNAITQGDIGTVTIDSGGTVEANALNETANGVIAVNGGSLSVSGQTTIGQTGTNAQLTLQSGTVTTNGLSIGNSAGATGTVTVSGGLLDSSMQVSIGNLGVGLLQVNSGGSVIASGLQLNNEGTADSTLIVNGGSLTDTGNFGVGNGGTGIASATVEAGGLLSLSGNTAIEIGSSGGTSTVVVSDGTFATSGGPLVVGPTGGSASLLVENGGTVITSFTGAGPAADINASGSGTAGVTVTGTGSVWDINTVGNDQLAIGDNGRGSLTVSDGAVVNAGTQNIVLGNQGSGTGFADVGGGNALLEGGNLLIGSGASHGTLEIDTGGSVDVASASVGEDGSLILAGGLLDPLGLTLNSGGVISGFGTLEANLTDNSSLTASGGVLEVTGSVTGTGTMTIAANGSLDLPGTVGAGQTIDFTANTGVLQVGTIGFEGTIDGIQSGDTIIITGVTDAVSANLLANKMLEITSTSLGTIDLQLDPTQNFSGDYFHVNTVGGNAVVTEDAVPCYLAGTRILTDRGEVPVETLRIGDCVVTLDGSAKPIKWIGRRSYSGAIPTGLRDVIPILIKQGALGDNLPARDLIVSPLHAMFCDGVLVPAEHLVNGLSILRAPDIDPIRYFHIELEHHDVIYAEGAPAETFVDCDSRAMFHNAAEFDSLYPGDATPRWRYCAPRVEGGERLDAVKRAIDRRAGIALPEPGTPPGRLEGRLDGVEGGRISGWAFHPDRPEAPVWLEVLDGDGVIARVHARRYRTDLEAAGVGDGRHGFELHLTGQMRTRKKIRVRRVEDGTELQGSPLVIEARGGEALLEDARRVIAAAIIDPSDTAALDALADELLHGVDALRQARAKAAGSGGHPTVIARSEAPRRSPAEERTGPANRTAAPSNGRVRRALIIDAQLPRPEHDAGSQAILSHAAALAGLGFQVEFVAAHQLARAEQASAALEQAGYVVHRVPLVASVEEVLRRHRNTFDVVYLHRLANAEAYAALARTWQARARLLYCVADLHHVRLARQAAVQASAELADAARAVRVRELNAMRLCDAVVTHSTAEAEYLAQVAPGASVHVVPWTPTAGPRRVPLAARRGVAAIGSWSHEPNVDAVRWLVSDIMPRVWDAAPRIELLVVGSDWPAHVAWITDPRVRLVGAVTSIETLLGMLRATVAPLRFGAGLKGKVLDSFACEVPCVMTPIAAEGFALEGALPGLVAEDAATLASLIVRLHEQTAFHRAAARDGLALAARFSAEAVQAAMATAIAGGAGSAARLQAKGAGAEGAPVPASVGG